MASVSRVSVQLPVGKVSITDDYTGESFQEFPRMFCFPALLVFIQEKESILSHTIPLMRSLRLPQNRKRISFSYESSWKLNFTMNRQVSSLFFSTHKVLALKTTIPMQDTIPEYFYSRIVFVPAFTHTPY